MNESTIMLVEDHPDDAFLTMHTLKKKQFNNVVVMDEAAKALDYLLPDGTSQRHKSTLPRLVIVDLKLPKMDGFEFIETLRVHEQTSRIPVVVLTSSTYGKDMERCSELGVDACFTKPLNIDEFLRVAEKLLVTHQ